MGPDRRPHNRPGNRQPEGAGSCRRPWAVGQPPAGRALRGGWSQPKAAGLLTLALVGVVALAGCQSVDWPWAAASASGGSAKPAAPAASSSAYPNLHTVPPRPQLSYSVQQRRAIVDGLVADREMARYTDQVVRYRTGQSSLPPPPAPPTVVADAVPEGIVAPIAPEAEVTAPDESAGASDNDGGDAYIKQFDDDTLGSFVDQLARDTDVEAPADAEPPPGAETPPDDTGDEAPGFFRWLGGLFGKAEAKPAEPAPEPAPEPAAEPEAGSAAPAPAAAATPEQPDRPRDGDAGPETTIEAAWVAAAAPLPSSRDAMERRAPADEPAPASGVTLAQAKASNPAPVPEARPSAGMAARPEPGATGIAVGAEGIAIGEERAEISDGRAAMPAPSPESPSSILVLFEPGSANLPPGVGGRLEQMLATAKAQGAMIRIEGEAAGAPALALDRARAVALGLMRLGASARDLEMALAPGASADQARLVLAGPAVR